MFAWVTLFPVILMTGTIRLWSEVPRPVENRRVSVTASVFPQADEGRFWYCPDDRAHVLIYLFRIVHEPHH